MTHVAPFGCACCGKPAKRAYEVVWNPWVERGEGPMDSNQTRETWDYVGKDTIIRREFATSGDAGARSKEFVLCVAIWDRKSWELKRGRFCSHECALKFAHAALNDGYRMGRE